MFIIQWIAKHKLVLLLALFLVAFAPLPIAALTNSEVIALYVESIKGFLALTRLAYCASMNGGPLC